VLIQVILAETTQEVIREYRAVASEVDLVELRLDRIADRDLGALFAEKGKPRIATCRSRAQGGFFSGGEPERQGILREAIRLGAEYVDLEFDGEDLSILPEAGNSTPLLSYHHRGGTPLDLVEIYERMAREAPGAVLKLIPYADSCTDNLRVRSILDRARGSGRRLIAFCMGDKGKVSRILAKAWGSWAVYAPARPDDRTAPGQILVSQLCGLYRFRGITAATPLCGVLGHPLSGSLSPLLHNRAYVQLGLDHRFLPFEAEQVAEFLPLLSELPIAALAVTHPHKSSMAAHCDELEEVARRVGAVNTVVRRWNRLVGSNTDAEGGVTPLRGRLALKGARVGILGAGGAARALAFGCLREGAKVSLFSRDRARGEVAARSLDCRWQPWSRAATFQGEVLVNATPVGMRPGPDESPVDWERIGAAWAYDLVYNPRRTRFLREAEAKGVQTIEGIEMFLSQATLQFEKMTGHPAPRELFASLLTETGRGPEEA
jgi:3-dehydroquinate dehydratase/shikimate dehydrogenase